MKRVLSLLLALCMVVVLTVPAKAVNLELYELEEYNLELYFPTSFGILTPDMSPSSYDLNEYNTTYETAMRFFASVPNLRLLAFDNDLDIEFQVKIAEANPAFASGWTPEQEVEDYWDSYESNLADGYEMKDCVVYQHPQVEMCKATFFDGNRYIYRYYTVVGGFEYSFTSYNSAFATEELSDALINAMTFTSVERPKPVVVPTDGERIYVEETGISFLLPDDWTMSRAEYTENNWFELAFTPKDGSTVFIVYEYLDMYGALSGEYIEDNHLAAGAGAADDLAVTSMKQKNYEVIREVVQEEVEDDSFDRADFDEYYLSDEYTVTLKETAESYDWATCIETGVVNYFGYDYYNVLLMDHSTDVSLPNRSLTHPHNGCVHIFTFMGDMDGKYYEDFERLLQSVDYPHTTEDIAAQRLYDLGLFSGKGTDKKGNPIFDLPTKLTRQESIVILLQLMGSTDYALNNSHTSPFRDVPNWAKPYIGYAYEAGLAKGISSTKFGSTDNVTLNQYLTFVLRALGYDSGSDFQWDKADKFAEKIGLIDDADDYKGTFTRGDACLIAESALRCNYKGLELTLIDLILTAQKQKTTVPSVVTRLTA